MWFAATAVGSGTLRKSRTLGGAIFARNVHTSVAWRGGKKDGQAHHYAVGGNRSAGFVSGNCAGGNQSPAAGQA